MASKEFDPKAFVEKQIDEIKKTVGDEKAVIAVSGGVDSSTCAVLTHLAIGNNLICVILDDAFMREGEPERVVQILSSPPLNLPVRIEPVQERFLKALRGLRDAEDKRKAFRDTFYKTLSEIAKKEKSRYLVQGTILADIIETKGGIKTQHNVLEQIGMSTRELYGFKVVEPLVTLLKWQVREVARYLKIPQEMSERQPFPGPGLSVRVVGEIRPDKLAALKKATTITEGKMAGYKPSQYFAAIIDNEVNVDSRTKKIEETTAKTLKIDPKSISAKMLKDKATGMKNQNRIYGDVLTLKCLKNDRNIHQASIKDLIKLQKVIIDDNPSITRFLYLVAEIEQKKPYVIMTRAIKTRDFLTAEVADIPWSTLGEIAKQILADCSNVQSVYHDVTPKPPATVEME